MSNTKNNFGVPQLEFIQIYEGKFPFGEKTMTKGQLLQDPFLNSLRKGRIPVSIYLVNGIKLQGQIESFDQYVVLLRNSVTQMVYKHAISTVVPARAVPLGNEQQGTEEAGTV